MTQTNEQLCPACRWLERQEPKRLREGREPRGLVQRRWQMRFNRKEIA